MLHRLVAMFIIGFWLAMTGLLIVRELYPEGNRLNKVPVRHVGKLMFQYQQPSSLKVFRGADEVGFLNIEPKISAANGARILDVNGNIAINPLGFGENRLSWHGKIELTSDFSMRTMKFNISTQDGGQLAVEVDAEAGKASFNTGGSARGRGSETITLDEDGLMKLISIAGLDSGILRHFRSTPAQIPPPEFDAQQSSTKLSGETLSTLLLTMKIGGQTAFEAHVSQLGQVIRAQAPILGYKLVPDNVAP